MANLQQSQFLTVSLQFVASHHATPRLWEVAMLLQVRGHGRPVCTETDSISVEAPWSTTSGSWLLLTASPGEPQPCHMTQHVTCLNRENLERMKSSQFNCHVFVEAISHEHIPWQLCQFCSDLSVVLQVETAALKKQNQAQKPLTHISQTIMGGLGATGVFAFWPPEMTQM